MHGGRWSGGEEECGSTACGQFDWAWLCPWIEGIVFAVRLVEFVRARSYAQTFTAVDREAALDEKTVRQIFADHVAQLSRRILEMAARRDNTVGMAYFTRATTRTRVAERRIVEYGPTIEMLVRQLEAGEFE